MTREGSKNRREKVPEGMPGFDGPPVPFWLMNFHIRGQSLCVTATLVLWPKTAY